MGGREMQNKYTIQTVQNAMQILKLFTTENKEWTLSEIAAKKSINISSTQRLLNTLEEYRYLERDIKTKKYKLGLSVLRLAGIVTTTMEIHREAQPILRELVETLGEAVHIGVLEGIETVYLNRLESKHPVRLASSIGSKNPAYCAGCGKVILAFKDENEQESIIQAIEKEGFHKLGSKTVQSVTELRNHLVQIKRQAYAVCSDEISEGISSIAAPIYDYNEKVVAAVSITGPTNRIDIQKAIERTVKAGKEISAELGYIY